MKYFVFLCMCSLTFQSCATNHEAEKFPDYSCFDNKLSANSGECAKSPRVCTGNKFRYITGDGIAGVGALSSIVGALSLYILSQASPVQSKAESTLLRTGFGGLGIGLPLVYLGTKITGNQCT